MIMSSIYTWNNFKSGMELGSGIDDFYDDKTVMSRNLSISVWNFFLRFIFRLIVRKQSRTTSVSDPVHLTTETGWILPYNSISFNNNNNINFPTPSIHWSINNINDFIIYHNFNMCTHLHLQKHTDDDLLPQKPILPI